MNIKNISRQHNTKYRKFKHYINNLRNLYTKIFYLNTKVYSLPENSYYLFENGSKLSEHELQIIHEYYKNCINKIFEMCGDYISVQQPFNPSDSGKQSSANASNKMARFIENISARKALPADIIQNMKYAKIGEYTIKSYEEKYANAQNDQERKEIIEEIQRLLGRSNIEQERILLQRNTNYNNKRTYQVFVPARRNYQYEEQMLLLN